MNNNDDTISPEIEEIPSIEELKESNPEEVVMQDFAIVLMTMTDPLNHNNFTSPIKQPEQKQSTNSAKFSSSTKSKMFKLLSNKENES